MARGRRTPQRGAERVGWLRWLVGTALLAAGGFALGVGVGVVMEDPALVLEHMTGRSVRVALDDGSSSELAGALAPAPVPTARPAAREHAAAGSAAPRARPAEPAKRAEAARTAAPANPSPPVAAAPPAAGFAVQVGAFETETAAGALVRRLRTAGFPAYVAPGTGADGERRFRVRVGPLPQRDGAERLAARLSEEQSLPTWVTREEGR